MARKTSADTFRQNLSGDVFKPESDFYRRMFGGSDVFPAIQIDRGNCESFRPPMIEYETDPVIENCYWERSKDEVFEGNYSYRLRKATPTGLRAYVTLTDANVGLHGLIDGHTYRFSCYAKVPTQYTNDLYIEMSDKSGGSRITPDSNFIGEWQQLEIERTFGEDAENIVIGIYTSQEMPEGVNMFFDNFELFSISPVVSLDFDGGSAYNEIELLRHYIRYYTEALNVVRAEDSELTLAANSFIRLQRGLVGDESDQGFLDRFRSLVVAKLNPRRTTRWSIVDSLSYFIEPSRIEFVERFDLENNKFRLRFLTFQQELESISGTMHPTVADQSYLDESYLTEAQVRQVRPLNPRIEDTLLRVKAAGVLVDSRNVTRRNIIVNGGFAVDLGASPINRLPNVPPGTQLALSDSASYVVVEENTPVDVGT